MVGKTPSSIKAQVKYLESTPVSIQTLQRCVCDILQKRGDDSNIVYCIFYEIVSQEFPGVATPLEISNDLSMRQNMMRPSWQPPKNFACLLSFFQRFFKGNWHRSRPRRGWRKNSGGLSRHLSLSECIHRLLTPRRSAAAVEQAIQVVMT